MKPTNNKSLLHFLFNQMDKLDKKETTVEEAKAIANLAKQVNNSLAYELKRASVLKELEGSTIKLREIELTNPDI
jgi:hypothetical protein